MGGLSSPSLSPLQVDLSDDAPRLGETVAVLVIVPSVRSPFARLASLLSTRVRQARGVSGPLVTIAFGERPVPAFPTVRCAR